MYRISPYSYAKAKTLGVKIVPSKRKNKKIDVYDKNGNYLTSVGDKRYLDYPTYLKLYGKTYANQRRRLYLIRHKNNTGKAGYYAENILW